MAVAVVYLGIWLMFILGAALASLAIASIAFGYLALIVRVNPTWSLWLSEPFWAPVLSCCHFFHDHLKRPLWLNRAISRYFINNLRWLRFSYGEGSIAARGLNANKKRHSVALLLALIGVSLLIASIVIGV
jgi:hypothetical protein